MQIKTHIQNGAVNSASFCSELYFLRLYQHSYVLYNLFQLQTLLTKGILQVATFIQQTVQLSFSNYHSALQQPIWESRQGRTSYSHCKYQGKVLQYT